MKLPDCTSCPAGNSRCGENLPLHAGPSSLREVLKDDDTQFGVSAVLLLILESCPK